MRSIPRSPYSVFKFLLVALAVLLLLSSVEALPAKGKHTAVALPHAHGTATPGAGVGAKPSVAKRVVKVSNYTFHPSSESLYTRTLLKAK